MLFRSDNPAANDLSVTETTFGNPACPAYPEHAQFEGSLDGINWINLGELCLDGELDIAPAGYIQYLRIKDRSAASSFSGSADGYDVDGIVAINCICAGPSGSRLADDVNTPDEIVSITVSPNPVNSAAVLTIKIGRAHV